MKISYNAPIILTFALLATLVMGLSLAMPGSFVNWFSAPPEFHFANLSFYTGVFLHPLAHANWNHLLGNFSLILLIGPILEEKYGSRDMLLMIVVTAILTGLLNAALFDTGIIGASGVVFMLILLSSFSNVQTGKIPITFILVVLLYLGQEIYSGLIVNDNISQFGHILGGICGGAFGFLIERKK